MKKSNTDRVVDYILSKADKLEAEKISALAQLVAALRFEVKESPDQEQVDSGLDVEHLGDQPIDLTGVTKVTIDGNEVDFGKKFA